MAACPCKQGLVSPRAMQKLVCCLLQGGSNFNALVKALRRNADAEEQQQQQRSRPGSPPGHKKGAASPRKFDKVCCAARDERRYADCCAHLLRRPAGLIKFARHGITTLRVQFASQEMKMSLILTRKGWLQLQLSMDVVEVHPDGSLRVEALAAHRHPHANRFTTKVACDLVQQVR